MDIELARTFLEIMRAGSFISAAKRLHVTQTTITARIRNLEDQLNSRLFTRGRSGAQLTAEGERFSEYATQMVRLWESAQAELPLPPGHSDVLLVGADTALWDPLLLRWTQWLRSTLPDMALKIETHNAKTLIDEVEHGRIDVAITYHPNYFPGVVVEQIMEEKLILIRNKRIDGPYIHINWGQSFKRQHEAALPGWARSGLSMDFGPMALKYIVENGGSSYLRSRAAASLIEQGVLERVNGAPEFTYPVFSMHRSNPSLQPLDQIFSGLRNIATEIKE
ncbi:MAG: LysR family transcriptional regulator [Spongiibacteraceae bacterium]|nr:LysR family transcriptional regulator [Spongiibacteraceae bacterium]